MDKDAFYEAYKKEKNRLPPDITPAAFQQVAASGDQKAKHGSKKKSEPPAIDDETFYKAFQLEQNHYPSEIVPEVFEQIIREDAAKMKYVSKFTNLFEKTLNESTSSKEPTIIFPRVGVPSTTQQQPQADEPSVAGSAPKVSLSDQRAAECSSPRVRILSSQMDEYWTGKITEYLNRYYNAQGCFASVFPILLKLERRLGPGWRLDQIEDPMFVSAYALPNSTINFNFPPSPRNYTIWRQRQPDF
ncbi:hypothetical protein CRM22_004634 [Opisthorchis felineus]|uniref:Uncharacterized protein n=1 Tax=Opisthorchis felineus TaxID=147828 RepID=A0A4S2LV52_OPIFE|nr:hypothetical protein CRM22_004634 [Opisthorchis felineus]TGZ67711.1 hypothetical protein CRM22_004634 [Opisthorchis felineus]TGZ67712.1 hypothetical protein CRM22_004634 [Opisthorchis felineus]